MTVLLDLCGAGQNMNKKNTNSNTKFYGVIRSPFQTVRSVMDRVYKYDLGYMESTSPIWRDKDMQ